MVDVQEESDKRSYPCMILKSDGAALYDTTDLATLCTKGRRLSAGRSYLCSR